MPLDQLIQEVYNLTNRPDLVNETTAAVRKATIKLHSIDYFYRDLVELKLTNIKQDYILEFDIPTYFTRFRSIGYMRPIDNSGTPASYELQPILPVQLFDPFHAEKVNVYYVGGSTLNIRLNNYMNSLLIGYYAYPDTATATYSSWIADQFPDAIIEEAAISVLRLIGYTDAANNLLASTQENRRVLLQNNLEFTAR